MILVCDEFHQSRLHHVDLNVTKYGYWFIHAELGASRGASHQKIRDLIQAIGCLPFGFVTKARNIVENIRCT